MEITIDDLKKINNLLIMDNEFNEKFSIKILNNLKNRTVEFEKMTELIKPSHIEIFGNKLGYTVNTSIDRSIIASIANMVNIGLALYTTFQEITIELIEKESQNGRGK